MQRIELRIPSLTPGAVAPLTELWCDWLTRASEGAPLEDVRIRYGGSEAIGTVRQGLRRIDVRLAHGSDDRWAIDASTLVEPEYEPTRGWSILAGLLMFLLGAMLSLGWSDEGPLALLGGLVFSVFLGVMVGVMTHRRRTDRQRTATTREYGGQAAAEVLLDRLAEVLRGDPRVELLAP